MMKRVSALTVALLLVGCVSMVERGNEAFEKGLYTEAAAFFEKAVAEDPNDLEAKQGLARARSKIVDQQLIDIRMLRMAANYSQAALKLQEILKMQSQWRTDAVAAQALTQNEEIRYATDWLKSEAKVLLNEKQPDKFRWFNHQFKTLIGTVRLSSTFDDYQQELSQIGKDKCVALGKEGSGQDFYYTSFVEKYCLAWSAPVSMELDNIDESRYSGISFTTDLNLNTFNNYGLRGQLEGYQSAMESAFTASPWFDRAGEKTAKFELNATVDYSRDSVSVQRQKRYMVTELRPDPNSVNGKVPVEVERVYLYPETTYQERFGVKVGYRGEVDGQKLWKTESENKSNRTQGHGIDYAEAGLFPVQPNFLDQSSIVGEELEKLKSAFSADLKTLWRDSYCRKANTSLVAESVFRCAAVEPKNGMVDNWFIQTFGIDYPKMKVLYGL
ncbi:hypothetical protein CS022_22225 [Veronia nyctiphanis]|uniref:Tetratricopeptide repeat protein n=1 Tax=Veronia nyctiphanis TaxID=1278244 RepID=A0A4Q0YJQ8_9GAMM|nr:tetratricopeptide repeat protein [Veronia nyctiphanis]RXJ70846.1 hypothetical protein CS022_22225 [Veronia nyctiphanis]